MTLTALGRVEKTGDALSYQRGWQIVITKRREEPSATFPSPVSDPSCTGAYARKKCGSRRYQTISIPEQWTRAPGIVFVRRCRKRRHCSDPRVAPTAAVRRCGASIPLRYCSLLLSVPTPRLFLTKMSLT